MRQLLCFHLFTLMHCGMGAGFPENWDTEVFRLQRTGRSGWYLSLQQDQRRRIRRQVKTVRRGDNLRTSRMWTPVHFDLNHSFWPDKLRQETCCCLCMDGNRNCMFWSTSRSSAFDLMRRLSPVFRAQIIFLFAHYDLPVCTSYFCLLWTIHSNTQTGFNLSHIGFVCS